MELVATYTVRGNRDPQTRKALPHELEITRHIPNVRQSHTIEGAGLWKVCGIREARRLATEAGATLWNF